jgi:xanthosine utilization system XapX-like protein
MPTSQQVDRRYPEAYEWNAKREKEGRTRMRQAPFIGVLVGIVIGFLPVPIWMKMKATPSEAIVFGCILGIMVGLGYYKWAYESGLNMVLQAQQMLVAIDTEHNTRRIAEALQQAETKGQPAQSLSEVAKA